MPKVWLSDDLSLESSQRYFNSALKLVHPALYAKPGVLHTSLLFYGLSSIESALSVISGEIKREKE